MENSVLKGIGAMGSLLFAVLFLWTFSDPQAVEKAGKSFVEWKLDDDIRYKIESINLPQASSFESLLGQITKEFRDKKERELTDLKNKLLTNMPLIISQEIAKMRNLDCACREKWEQKLRTSLEFKINSFESSKQNLIDFSQAKYMEIVKRLTNDVRVFIGVNLSVFVILLIVSLAKPLAGRHLLLPCALMIISMVFCSYFYIFEQNWFYTIIYNDYTGYTYLGYLMAVFGILCDIAFNKAKVTTETLNVGLNAIGSAFKLVPC